MLQGVSRKIGRIQFSFLSPEEIRNMSAMKIMTPDTYDDDGFPIPYGLMDPVLGVIEPGLRCKSCGGRVEECSGHFGHIDLAMPVIHVGYIKIIKMLLDVTCRECGRLLRSEEEMADARKMFEQIEGEVQPSVITTSPFKYRMRSIGKDRQICPHCGTQQKAIVLDKPTTFRENGHKITPREIRDRFERMPNEDLQVLGLNTRSFRPEWLILTALPVPPVTVRPSITLDSGDRSEDDLTHKLVDVIRINHRLRENRDNGAPQLIIEDLWELLQYHITTYFDNQTSGIPPARHRSGRPLRTLVQRLKGKEGRFRSNLSGKRVNFSSRTVISPDPYISILEVGVPEAIARELTIPIRALPSNLEVLKDIIMRGHEPRDEAGRYISGVNYVIRPDGRRLKVTENNKETIMTDLEPGFIVERQIADGDIVLFNRQPSLHRMSMMAHRVRILPGKTFRLNLCVCPPYNADFDGDEMNLHVPQSEEARAEAIILMSVQEHILSPRFGGPVIGMTHDHVTGMFMLTQGKRVFNRTEVELLLSTVSGVDIPDPAGKDRGGEPYWTGKQLFSLLLERSLKMEFKSAILGKSDPDSREAKSTDGYVNIFRGRLSKGTIDGNAVGAFRGKLLDRIARDYGVDAARRFLDQATKLALGMIMLHGFTTGLDDEDIPSVARMQINEKMVDASENVEKLIRAYEEGTLEVLPGRSLEETLEVEIMKELGKARDRAGDIADEHLGLNNSAVIMARSGARGSMLNLSQMAGCIGQQAVRGERISRGYRGRTLPHFRENDKGAEAKGFVKASYKTGMNPTEYFFHSMGGREALVDTAVRTSRSGYMQRRLINALEDLKVVSDGSVRNTAGTIIQFRYGEDGIDPARCEQGVNINVDNLIAAALGWRYGEVRSHMDEIVGYGELEEGPHPETESAVGHDVLDDDGV